MRAPTDQPADRQPAGRPTDRPTQLDVEHARVGLAHARPTRRPNHKYIQDNINLTPVLVLNVNTLYIKSQVIMYMCVTHDHYTF